jgi:N-methylhydantoinase A
VEAMAGGIVRLANEHMARALRVMSVQRGIDPRKLTLVSFGGAGGLHVCALADALAMHEAMVPVQAGVLSAMGMLVAPKARQLSQSFSGIVSSIDENQLRNVFDELTHKGKQALRLEGLKEQEIQSTASVDMRYKGQSYALNIPWLGKEKTLDSFHFNHEQRYGHRLELAVEVVTARIKVYGLSHDVKSFEKLLAHENRSRPARRSTTALYGIGNPVPVFQRMELPVDYNVQGPALITDTVSTTFIEPGWRCHADQVGNLLLHKEGA